MKKIRVDKAEYKELLLTVKTLNDDRQKELNNQILRKFTKTLQKGGFLKGEHRGCIYHSMKSVSGVNYEHTDYGDCEDVVNIDGIDFLYTRTRPLNGELTCSLTNGMLTIEGQPVYEKDGWVCVIIHSISNKGVGYLSSSYIDNKYTGNWISGHSSMYHTWRSQ